ncbi:MAG: DUF4595 domain-containing protein [Bacteroidales bacterium]|nr:DUF4595 domain-containing protein [Bacteroidales bacterium]
MKKLFFFVMAAVTVLTVSCKKAGQDDQKEPEGPKYRIATLAYCDGNNLEKPDDAGWYDTWYYTYDDQGRVIDVDRKDGDKKHFTFTYEGNKVTISRKDGQRNFILTLNDKGVCTSITDDVKDPEEWGPYQETAVFEYDATLRPTKITKEGELRSELTWRDNCLVSWTKAREDNRKRSFTYNTTKNIGDLHAIYSEAIDPPARWLYETGLFGHGPEYLPATSVWEDDPENGSTITCEVDENGYCVSEKKTFPADSEGKVWTEYFLITWEEIKK